MSAREREEQSIPLVRVFSHDVKYEETAQGLRIHAHAYSNSAKDAAEEAMKTYKAAIAEVENEKMLRAPMEIKKPKEEKEKK